jgi:hypothetical protein
MHICMAVVSLKPCRHLEENKNNYGMYKNNILSKIICLYDTRQYHFIHLGLTFRQRDL